ncbi:MAG: helix-turn-helix domain-containing protein [Planctomycetales bacterium]|nr:helix-turn-helix domain-containing protein [bacterium]UNM07327.1 MAG: helix-turn-helix domain-containing protein [Planctomycetales bacterium]
MSRIFSAACGTCGDIKPVPAALYTQAIARKKTVLVNAEALRKVLDEKEIKQWWLARRIGVDRKSITRWVNGQTQRISEDNIKSLAAELDCSIEQLTVHDSLEALGSREDRWNAARRLQDSNLTEMVGPSYSWELAESLIRSTIDPEMPLDLQAALYMQLAVCGIYMHKHEMVRSTAEIALRKATEYGDETLALRAETMLGNEALMIGELTRAVGFYDKAIQSRDKFAKPSKLAGTLSNYAMALHMRGDYLEALAMFDEAVSVWQEAEPVISMTTAWFLKARLHSELMMLDEAYEAIEHCREVCRQISFRKSANMCIAISADLSSMQDRHEEAVAMVREAQVAFEETPNVSPESNECLIRVLRRAGHVEESRASLEELMARNIDDRYSIARLYVEMARHLMLDGNEGAAWDCVEKANELYTDIGAPKRVMKELPGESYIDFHSLQNQSS